MYINFMRKLFKGQYYILRERAVLKKTLLKIVGQYLFIIKSMVEAKLIFNPTHFVIGSCQANDCAAQYASNLPNETANCETERDSH